MAWREVNYSMKRHMYEDKNEHGFVIYVDPIEHWSMQRETLKEDGETYDGVWVLRNQFGTLVGYDQYRFDLEYKYDLRLVLKIS